MAKKTLGYKACFNRLEKAVIKWATANGHDPDGIAYGGDVDQPLHYTWVFSPTEDHPAEYRATCDRLTGKVEILKTR